MDLALFKIFQFSLLFMTSKSLKSFQKSKYFMFICAYV